jgi:hypothetical protein
MPTEEQLKEIQDFYNGAASKALFEEMEAGLMQDWSTTSDLASREQLWNDVQALRRLQAGLRDATANKRLTQHNARRVYTA